MPVKLGNRSAGRRVTSMFLVRILREPESPLPDQLDLSCYNPLKDSQTGTRTQRRPAATSSEQDTGGSRRSSQFPSYLSVCFCGRKRPNSTLRQQGRKNILRLSK
ncbi:hypothetical protein DPEC_G00340390 [Dallia pectoralis]|uniref:Uncharacterized protein n=1 Tax=Dallia pectoralis TaxID=75939 RepID=A0ACC2F556_DALPE|nr:hypothetical protein DPEC_G00340390 [Dallia pectoralis]